MDFFPNPDFKIVMYSDTRLAKEKLANLVNRFISL